MFKRPLTRLGRLFERERRSPAIWIGDAAAAAPFAPGQLLALDRDTVQTMQELTEHPVVVLPIDTPHRDPGDVTVVDAEDGDAASFVARNAGA